MPLHHNTPQILPRFIATASLWVFIYLCMLKRIGPVLESRWILLLVLLVFVGCKIQHLHYPFYLDEAWVYAPAVKAMAVHGPSLFPDAIIPDLSRGHPLMFHFLAAIWIKCFGASNISMHTFPLLISIVFLIALYEACRKLFDARVATLALLLVATRVIFFVDSSFVYPEVMVAMCAFLSYYFYVRDRFSLTAFMLTMLFFTKEGGVIFGIVLGIDAFIALFRNTTTIQHRLLRLTSIIAPAVLIALFFVLQKAKLGWYVLPEHSGMIISDWNTYYYMFRRGIYWNYRGDLALCALAFFGVLLSILPAIKYRNLNYLFLVPPVVIVYLLADMFPPPQSLSLVWFIASAVCFSLPAYCLLKVNKTLTPQARKFIILVTIGVQVFLLYSSLTQIGYRYLLVNIVFILVFLAVCYNTFIQSSNRSWYYITIAGILLIGVFGFYTNDRYEDTQLGAYRVMNVEMQAYSFLEKEQAYDKEIAFACTWTAIRLNDTAQGFLRSKRIFTNLQRFPITPTTQYAIFGNSCEDKGDYLLMQKNPDFHLVYQVRDGDMWAAIYKRN